MSHHVTQLSMTPEMRKWRMSCAVLIWWICHRERSKHSRWWQWIEPVAADRRKSGISFWHDTFCSRVIYDCRSSHLKLKTVSTFTRPPPPPASFAFYSNMFVFFPIRQAFYFLASQSRKCHRMLSALFCAVSPGGAGEGGLEVYGKKKS